MITLFHLLSWQARLMTLGASWRVKEVLDDLSPDDQLPLQESVAQLINSLPVTRFAFRSRRILRYNIPDTIRHLGPLHARFALLNATSIVNRGLPDMAILLIDALPESASKLNAELLTAALPYTERLCVKHCDPTRFLRNLNALAHSLPLDHFRLVCELATAIELRNIDSAAALNLLIDTAPILGSQHFAEAVAIATNLEVLKKIDSRPAILAFINLRIAADSRAISICATWSRNNPFIDPTGVFTVIASYGAAIPSIVLNELLNALHPNTVEGIPRLNKLALADVLMQLPTVISLLTPEHVARVLHQGEPWFSHFVYPNLFLENREDAAMYANAVISLASDYTIDWSEISDADVHAALNAIAALLRRNEPYSIQIIRTLVNSEYIPPSEDEREEYEQRYEHSYDTFRPPRGSYFETYQQSIVVTPSNLLDSANRQLGE